MNYSYDYVENQFIFIVAFMFIKAAIFQYTLKNFLFKFYWTQFDLMYRSLFTKEEAEQPMKLFPDNSSYDVFKKNYFEDLNFLWFNKINLMHFEFDIMLLMFFIFIFNYSVYGLIFKKKELNFVMSVFTFSLVFFILMLALSVTVFIQNFCFLDNYSSVYSFNFSYCNDAWIFLMRIFIIYFIILSLILFEDFVFTLKYTSIEFFLLINFSAFFSIILISVTDIFALLIIFEILSFIILGFIVLEASSTNIKAAKQYFVYNTVITGISLLGVLAIFFITKTFQFFFCYEIFQIIVLQGTFKLKIFLTGILGLWICNFLFKLGIFPFNTYVPIMYESMPLPVIFFVSSIIKFSVFLMLTKVINQLLLLQFIKYFLFALSVISFVLSAILILNTVKLKRFLGLTSINLNSFLIICLLINSNKLTAFAIIYSLLYNLAMFSVVSVFIAIGTDKREFQLTFPELKNLLQGKKNYKLILTLSLLFMSGLPPLPIFFYKYLIYLNFVWFNYYVLVILLILTSVLSFYYYMKLLQCIWVKDDFKELQHFDKIKLYVYFNEFFFANGFFLSYFNFLIIVVFSFIYPIDNTFFIIETTIDASNNDMRFEVELPSYQVEQATMPQSEYSACELDLQINEPNEQQTQEIGSRKGYVDDYFLLISNLS